MNEAMYFLSHGADGEWFIVQDPFRRRQVESLLQAGRRVLLVQTGGERHLPSIYLVTSARQHDGRHRYAVSFRVRGVDQYGEDLEPDTIRGNLLSQVPGSSYLVTAL